ncbi:hypothetical protein [Chryseobacterium suipulveris]|nr:hypothetical protein [Chryseobacterium suipulveris]
MGKLTKKEMIQPVFIEKIGGISIAKIGILSGIKHREITHFF